MGEEGESRMVRQFLGSRKVTPALLGFIAVTQARQKAQRQEQEKRRQESERDEVWDLEADWLEWDEQEEAEDERDVRGRGGEG